jgi:hypothetical protein
LRRSQPTQAQREHDAAQQRQRGERAAHEGHDADGAAEVVHIPLESTGEVCFAAFLPQSS